MACVTEKWIPRVLVIGAGGLGCEMVRNLVMLGVTHIEIVDLDTIELSNLSRQMLYSRKDIGQAKAVVASEYIAKNFTHCFTKSHVVDIEAVPGDFYRFFNVVLCAVDNIKTRIHINRIIMSLAQYDEDNTLIADSCPILIDGGTEGLKGHARIVIHGNTPCLECFYNLFVKEEKYAICSVSGKLRRPEQCVHYAKIIMWEKEHPFNDAEFDGRNIKHITWIYTKAKELAQENKLELEFRMVKDILTNTVPAVACTQSIVACLCVRYVQRILEKESCEDNFINVNTSHGIHLFNEKLLINDECDVCSTRVYVIDCHKYRDMRKLFERLRRILNEQLILCYNLYLVESTGEYTFINRESEENCYKDKFNELENFRIVAICTESKRKIVVKVRAKK